MKRLFEALITCVAVAIMLFPAASGLMFFVRENASLSALSSNGAAEIDSDENACVEADFNLCRDDAF